MYEHQVAAGRGMKICVVNKVDGLSHHKLVPQLAAVQQMGEFDEIVPVSAQFGEGVEVLRDLLVSTDARGPAALPVGLRSPTSRWRSRWRSSFASRPCA